MKVDPLERSKWSAIVGWQEHSGEGKERQQGATATGSDSKSATKAKKTTWNKYTKKEAKGNKCGQNFDGNKAVQWAPIVVLYPEGQISLWRRQLFT